MASRFLEISRNNASFIGFLEKGDGPGAVATSFDGSSDSASIAAAVSGLADGPTLTYGLWFRRPAASAFGFILEGGTGTKPFDFSTQTINRVLTRIDNTNAAVYDSAFLSGYADAGNWNHFAASYDRATGARNRWLNGVSTSDTGGPTGFDLAIVPDVLKLPDLYEMDLSEVYVSTGFISDITKLRTAGGKPANLGADGSLVTGVTPEIYAPTGDISDNRGSGGNGTITGAPVQIAGPGV